MKHLLKILIGVLVVVILSVETIAAPAPPRWETVDTVVASLSDERIDIAVRDNYIYVFTPRPVTAKLFTILGQPVTQAQLPAGTSRLRIDARGIYILKVGSITRRITI